ncbi:alpha-mannosidase [Microbacterium koreense]|uniref:Alpha-mannosidase n=1 Tax=Microbacterium koreense TaxID=323761 RepID=A0ABW2ZPW5_9MICO
MGRDLEPGRVTARVDRALSEWIEPAVTARSVDMTTWILALPGEPVPFADLPDTGYRRLIPGDRWGPPWSTAWIRVTGRVPHDWPRGQVEAHIDLGFDGAWPGFQAEGLAYATDGRILKGLEPRNTHVRLDARPGDEIAFFVEAAANPDILRKETFSPTPLGHRSTAGDVPLYTFGGARLVHPDQIAQELLDDVRMLRDLVEILPADRPRSIRVRAALYDMLTVLDPHDVAGTAAEARSTLADALAQPSAASAHRVAAVGHAHIDSAWLWPLRETVRKCARTFANVLDLMDEDPDLVFACSSAQQYDWIQEHYPDLFRRIAERVADGRWVVTGGMWVESDTMMPGGEALARQFIEGGAYFRREFGIACDGVWLPDSFGYSAGMPQIAVGAGARWFLTQKLSWNDTNRMPHHTFWWRGLDGTRIFTHFPPSDTYSAQVTPRELDLAERQFTEHADATSSLMLFGHGDGGGGPTRRMLAAARRAADLEGLPRVQIVSPDVFFARAEAQQPDASVWSGEIPLELHRGTLTSQARTKAANRRNERLLHEAELWATTASVRAGAAYPSAALRGAWRTVLLLQFHDILPGSSIAWVHEEAERLHAEVSASLTAIIDDALRAIVGDGDLELAANAGAFAQDGVDPGAVAAPVAAIRANAEAVDGCHVLEDHLARVVIDSAGDVRSFTDRRTGRELVTVGGRWGDLRLHPDHPARWDAWDIERPYADVTLRPDGGAQISVDDGIVRVRRRAGASTFTQEWWLTAGRLETTLVVDWRERDRLLKIGFPLAVHADTFTTETQFGHVARPVHRNTSWDEARFEVCQHRWMHIGEPGFGVAIANDTAYGVAVTADEGVDVGISVLRGTSFPDPAADLGQHRFRFSIAATSDVTDAVRLGRTLDAPPTAVRGGATVEPLVRVEASTMVLETLKLTEDGSGDVIIRLSETRGDIARAVVHTDFGWREAVVTDLHEIDATEDSPLRRGVNVTADPSARTIAVTDRPFGLITLRLRR